MKSRGRFRKQIRRHHPTHWLSEGEGQRRFQRARRVARQLLTGQEKPWGSGEFFKEVEWEGRKSMSLISDILNLNFESVLKSTGNRKMFILNDKVFKRIYKRSQRLNILLLFD